MFKIGAALVFAVIAALTVILAGLMANARYSVIFFRALTGFVVSGALIYLASFLFERYELPAFWRRQDSREEKQGEAGMADASAEDDGDASEQVDVAGSTQEETSERKAAESGGAGEFVPLATDGLKHVSSPQV